LTDGQRKDLVYMWVKSPVASVTKWLRLDRYL